MFKRPKLLADRPTTQLAKVVAEHIASSFLNVRIGDDRGHKSCEAFEFEAEWCEIDYDPNCWGHGSSFKSIKLHGHEHVKLFSESEKMLMLDALRIATRLKRNHLNDQAEQERQSLALLTLNKLVDA